MTDLLPTDPTFQEVLDHLDTEDRDREDMLVSLAMALQRLLDVLPKLSPEGAKAARLVLNLAEVIAKDLDGGAVWHRLFRLS